MVNKEVLFSELCSRLPYEVKCDIGDDKPYTLNSIEVDYVGGHLVRFKEMKNGLIMEVYLSEVKPYLFPLSSMTPEQRTSYNFLSNSGHRSSTGLIDFFNKNHLDYKGLIPKGLAKNATGLNIY
jgi:hypothetical protein